MPPKRLDLKSMLIESLHNVRAAIQLLIKILYCMVKISSYTFYNTIWKLLLPACVFFYIFLLLSAFIPNSKQNLEKFLRLMCLHLIKYDLNLQTKHLHFYLNIFMWHIYVYRWIYALIWQDLHACQAAQHFVLLFSFGVYIEFHFRHVVRRPWTIWQLKRNAAAAKMQFVHTHSAYVWHLVVWSFGHLAIWPFACFARKFRRKAARKLQKFPRKIL